MTMQNEPDNWRKRNLEAAAATLEKYAEVPDWLKLVVRDALSVADDLVPPSDYQPASETHLYPH